MKRQTATDRETLRATAHRHGFTLVELLVVISIIALLASIVMFAMAGAQEAARGDRTRGQIARLHALLAERWESYLTRRVPSTPPVGRNANDPVTAAKLAMAFRVDAIRELMRMELPDRKSDLLSGCVVLAREPPLWRAYRRKVESLMLRAGKTINWAAEENPDREIWTTKHQGAECLYLILSQISEGDTRALSYFAEKEIGDTDGDSVPEILDAWGNPIEFLRWAPGFLAVGSYQDRESPDPFDPRGAYAGMGTFALFPLVFSAGPDKEYEINTGGLDYSATWPPNNPYVRVGEQGLLVGEWNDKNGDGRNNSIDNIHNHLLNAGS